MFIIFIWKQLNFSDVALVLLTKLSYTLYIITGILGKKSSILAKHFIVS